MKLTKREKTIWLIVGIAVLLMLIYNFVSQGLDKIGAVKSDRATLEETNRLLRAEKNIIARHQAVDKQLDNIKDYFLSEDPESAQIILLKEVEKLASQANLTISQKNVLALEQKKVGVSIEGSTTSEQLIRFLHQVTVSRLALNLKRLQLHTNPETRELKYQMILETMRVE